MNDSGYIETARLIRGGRWLALVCAALAGWRAVTLFRLADRPGFLYSPLLWLLLAGVAFGAATLAWIPYVSGLTALRTRRWALWTTLACTGVVLLGYTFKLLPQPILVACWIVAQIFWVASFVPHITRPQRPSRAALIEAATFGGVFLVAAALRLYKAGSLPVNFHGDFASVGLQARALLAGDYEDFFGTGWAAFPLQAYWPTAILMGVFGDNPAGLASFARLGGLASLVALYLLTRELFGWRAAVFASALLAGDITHIHYSRVVAYMDPVPFVAWSIYFAALGIRRGKGWHFALSGILAGHAFLSYYSGRIVIPLAAASVALIAIAAPRLLKRRIPGLAIAAFGLLIVAGPTLIFFQQHSGAAGQRTESVLILNPNVWRHTAQKHGVPDWDARTVMGEQIRRAAEAFWKFNDGATQFGIERNMLEPIAGVLLIFGLGYAFWHFGRPALLFVLGWAAGYIVASALTVDPPFSGRLVGLTLPVAILSGVALDRALHLFPRGRHWGTLTMLAGLAVIAMSGARNWRDYVAWGTDPRTAHPPIQVARFLMQQPAKYQVRLASRSFSWDVRELRFLLPHRVGESLDPAAMAEGRVLWPRAPAIFILSPEYQSLADTLRKLYPRGRLVDGSLPPLKGIFWAYFTE